MEGESISPKPATERESPEPLPPTRQRPNPFLPDPAHSPPAQLPQSPAQRAAVVTARLAGPGRICALVRRQRRAYGGNSTHLKHQPGRGWRSHPEGAGPPQAGQVRRREWGSCDRDCYPKGRDAQRLGAKHKARSAKRSRPVLTPWQSNQQPQQA